MGLPLYSIRVELRKSEEKRNRKSGLTKLSRNNSKDITNLDSISDSTITIRIVKVKRKQQGLNNIISLGPKNLSLRSSMSLTCFLKSFL
jgi:hypothetical protein